MKRSVTLFLAIAMIFALCACNEPGPAPTSAPTPEQTPVTTGAVYSPVIYKNHGKRCAVYSMPEKALAIGPNCAEVLCSLGVSDHVIGKCMVNHSHGAPESLIEAYDAIPTLTVGYPTLSDILHSGCDFVYATDWLFSESLTVDMLENNGINVYVSEATDYTGLWQEIRDIGSIFGVRAEADEFILSEQLRMKRVASAIKDAPPQTVLVVDSLIGDKVFTAGGKNIETAYIASAGCSNVFSSLEESWAAVTPQEIEALDPDFVIIHDYSGSDFESTLSALHKNKTLSRLDCVRNGRIIKLPLENLMPGVRSALTVETIAYTVFYERFSATPATDAPD